MAMAAFNTDSLSSEEDSNMPRPRHFTFNLTGDVMLGRLIDQLLPTHVHEPSEARIVRSLVTSRPSLKLYGPSSPWGNMLHLLRSGDLNLINLETSATTFVDKWPDKVFNYRMHPDNVSVLQEAKVDYAGLANNHSLDFREQGLYDTVYMLKGSGIAFAGAGLGRMEAQKAAVLKLPRHNGSTTQHRIHIWAASDHPSEWRGVPDFSWIDYSSETRSRLKSLMSIPAQKAEEEPSLRIFSVHWGPNYSWQPSASIRKMAHFLIDECGVDIVHGHSSHHIQGVEVYHEKLIVYGCGDFVDDYALVPEYRNDLGALWRVSVVETTCSEEQNTKLKVKSLEVWPTRIKDFSTQLLSKGEADWEWTKDKFTELSEELGTRISKIGDHGQIVIDL